MRFTQGRLVAVVSFVAVAGTLALPAAGQGATPISGGWSGQVDDTSTPEPYETNIVVKNKLKRGEKGGESFYPLYDCGGDLIFKRLKKRTGEYVFKEELTVGIPNCIDGGKVVLSRVNKKLLYEYSSGDGSATGKLSRLDPT
jgi:hypothetical protein